MFNAIPTHVVYNGSNFTK